MKTERVIRSLLEMLELDASEFVRLMVSIPDSCFPGCPYVEDESVHFFV